MIQLVISNDSTVYNKRTHALKLNIAILRQPVFCWYHENLKIYKTIRMVRGSIMFFLIIVFPF